MDTSKTKHNDAKNEFLSDLLSLQQDGSDAISAPANWLREPLLQVDTEVDEIISELESNMLSRNKRNETARWHFFIGSPGNGKSAAMGDLYRRLKKQECRVTDENGVDTTGPGYTDIPYALDVYEGKNKFRSAKIVQDASVVRNPYSENPDPARELLDTVKQAWEAGISLVVCTNRGVLEKTHGDFHMDKTINKQPWFKILTDIVNEKSIPEKQFEGGRICFKKVKVRCSHLDKRSLLLGCNTFDQVLQKATHRDRWAVCSKCPVKARCPFKANRDWLANEKGRKGILQLLRRAEVLSNQVIVFREALALVSLVLAGCPKDYEKTHPCEWVQENVVDNNIFALATRRVYMLLFASQASYGLETVSILREKQEKALAKLAKVMDGRDKRIQEAVKHVLQPSPPSTDTGVTRLLGATGCIVELDPCRETLPVEFYEQWDTSCISSMKDDERALFTPLEKDCISVWEAMEGALELVTDALPEAHWALRRWSSNFLLHFGALCNGRSAWSEGLDKFTQLFEILNTPGQGLDRDSKRQIKNLNREIKKYLDVGLGHGEKDMVQLSENVILTGEWVSENFKPKAARSSESGSLALEIKFTSEGVLKPAVFPAEMYLWLARLAKEKLEERCFPRELLSGILDARIRVVSEGKYAFQNDDIKLIVKTGKDDGEVFEIERFEGEVEINQGGGND